jgi:predicted nuclease of restriction endonuclease-like RecB superfamily
MTRQTKTPTQRANEALETARRVEIRAMARLQKAEAEVEAAQADLRTVRERLAYAGLNPALDPADRQAVVDYLDQLDD